MHAIAPFTFDADKASTALALVECYHSTDTFDLPEGMSSEFYGYAESDPASFNPVWDLGETSIVDELIGAAVAEGWITGGPGEDQRPHINYEDGYYQFSVKVGGYAGFHVGTDWQEARHVVGRDASGEPLRGTPAALDLLADMVTDLNGVLARLTAFAAPVPKEVRELAFEVAGWEDGFCNVETADDLAAKVLAACGVIVPPREGEGYPPEVAARLAAAMNGDEPPRPRAEEHPEHTECADGCGLAITHDGACLDKPGGRVVCSHEEEDPEDDDEVWDGVCGHCGRLIRCDTRQDRDGSTRCDDGDPKHTHHVPEGAKPYIRHEDVQTPTNGIAYFGPFSEEEMGERLNDAYADLLADCGNVDGVLLTDAEAAGLCFNTRDYWMEQLRQTGD